MDGSGHGGDFRLVNQDASEIIRHQNRTARPTEQPVKSVVEILTLTMRVLHCQAAFPVASSPPGGRSGDNE